MEGCQAVALHVRRCGADASACLQIPGWHAARPGHGTGRAGQQIAPLNPILWRTAHTSFADICSWVHARACMLVQQCNDLQGMRAGGRMLCAAVRRWTAMRLRERRREERECLFEVEPAGSCCMFTLRTPPAAPCCAGQEADARHAWHLPGLGAERQGGRVHLSPLTGHGGAHCTGGPGVGRGGGVRRGGHWGRVCAPGCQGCVVATRGSMHGVFLVPACARTALRPEDGLASMRRSPVQGAAAPPVRMFLFLGRWQHWRQPGTGVPQEGWRPLRVLRPPRCLLMLCLLVKLSSTHLPFACVLLQMAAVKKGSSEVEDMLRGVSISTC